MNSLMHSRNYILKTINRNSRFAFGLTSLLWTAGMILWLASPFVEAGEIHDRIDFGSPESEQRHRFESANTEAPAGNPGQRPEVYVESVTPGSAGLGWIEYKLNQPITLERVKMTWGGNSSRRFYFDIQISLDAENWKTVVSGSDRKRTAEHTFDPVKARYIKVIKGGMAGWWRPKTWKLKKIQFNDLAPTDAYRSSHSVYEPALGESCRRLLADKNEDGARMRFTMKTAPDEQNYFTVKFWGGDQRGINLRLHDGDGNDIDGAASEWGKVHKPMGPFWEFGGLGHRENFVYATYPLPPSVTLGNRETTLELSASGDRPSHGIYAAYTHNEPFLTPPADEKQGQAFEVGPQYGQQLTSDEIEETLKQRARKLVEKVLSKRPKPRKQGGARRLKALSDAYHAEWSEHYQDPEIVDVVKEAIDAAVERQANKGVGGHMGGHKWHYQGLMARALTNIGEAFKESGVLEEKIDHDGDAETAPISRRNAYDWYFQKGYEWRSTQAGARREVSNQSMAVSFSLFRMQKALQLLDSDDALSRIRADRYLYEALGMKPFYAPYPRRGWVKAAADAGFPFYIITPAGLALEGGHASHYGELAPARVARMAYELDDPAAKERASEIIRARVIAARRPGNDGAGYAVLKSVFPFTYRGRSYPGGIRYLNDEEFTNAAILEDPVSLRMAELYLKHGQFTKHTRQDRVVRRVKDYLKVKDMLENRNPPPLPIEPDHGDFAWADETAGIFVIKHAETLVHGSFVLSKPGAVVPIARVHHSTPEIERLADVITQFKTPVKDDEFVAPGGLLGKAKFPRTPPPPKLDSNRVEQWRSRDIRASMAYFYSLRFGDYLIGMNTTQKGTYRESTFTLDIPKNIGTRKALNLTSGKMIDLTSPVKVPPESTVVLYLPNHE